MSYGNNDIGGYLSNAFFGTALYQACTTGDISATWEKVMEKTYSEVKRLIKDQEPYYVINLKQTPTTPPPASTPVNVIAAEPTFAGELATLLDGSHSEEWLNNQVNYLANKYFTSDSKVITVGRNGTTILEHEAARLYLRRIATSGKISKINVVNEKINSGGKHSYIKVQEIRKSK